VSVNSPSVTKINSFSTSPGRRPSWFHSLSSRLSSSHAQSATYPPAKSSQYRSAPPTPSVPGTVGSSQLGVPLTPTKSAPSIPIPVLNNMNSNLPTNKFLETHPPRTASPKINPETVSGSPELSRSPEINRSGSLVNRLKRISSRVSTTPDNCGQPGVGNPEMRVVLNKNPSRKQPKVPELAGVLPLRVNFRPEVLEYDPPQQIPSRNPRAGNISFGANGEINRSPLPNSATTSTTTTASGYLLPRNYTASTLTASQVAYESALRVAHSVKQSYSSSMGVSIFKSSKQHSNSSSNFLPPSPPVDDLDKPADDNTRSNVKMIDTPMHNTEHIGSEADDNKEKQKDTSLEAIYTRCCHLREILPIAATMKQIKDREAPLQVLKMMNPRPTLIEILSLSDFLSVVPVCMLILDNVSLSDEMLRIIFSAVINSKELARLSLRNTSLDRNGWKILCAFLSENSAIAKLDLSIQRTKTKPPPDRSILDWGLLTRALVARGGIEELIINGCMVPSTELEELILQGCCLSTKRLGLAVNDLHPEDIDVIRRWAADPSCCCEGLDLGGNDLNSSWDAIREILSGRCLIYISLNSTNLSNADKLAQVFDELCEQSALKLVDLSSNPGLFPKFTSKLAHILPRFKDLRRIHLDSNNLSSEDIVALADSFARCPNLVHISLLDNRRLDTTACAGLLVATHLSSTLYTIECDQDLWPPAFQRRLAHNCMVNMELIAGRLSQQYKDTDDEGLFDRDDLMDTGNAIADAAGKILDSTSTVQDDEAIGHMVAQEMVRRAKQVRSSIRKTLDTLFSKRQKEGLTTEEKERLIRLCFLDGNLEKVITRYNSQQLAGSTPGRLSKMAEHILTLMPVDRNLALTTPHPTHSDLQIAPVNENDEIETLSRKSSSTSLHRKEQELEEGELHKFGTFIGAHQASIEEPAGGPSTGEELRQAILEAKGPHSVTELIQELEKTHGPELGRVLNSRGCVPAAINATDFETGNDDAAKNDDDQHALDSVVDDIAKALT
jgi:hypothetical protein